MNTDELHKAVTEYVISSGKRLLSEAGHIQDIGVAKRYLTEEDLAIERGFKEIVGGEGHALFAEEENLNFIENNDIWVVDPISQTSSFIKGLGHYAVVASHIHKSKVKYAVVYDPSVDELFTATDGGGAFLNGNKIVVSSGNETPPAIIFNRSSVWQGNQVVDEFWLRLNRYGTIYRNTSSFAVNYCYVACGRFDGIVALAKDPFPEYAGSLIMKEAGGKFTNSKGDEIISPTDKGFVGGNHKTYNDLFGLVSPLFKF